MIYVTLRATISSISVWQRISNVSTTVLLESTKHFQAGSYFHLRKNMGSQCMYCKGCNVIGCHYKTCKDCFRKLWRESIRWERERGGARRVLAINDWGEANPRVQLATMKVENCRKGVIRKKMQSSEELRQKRYSANSRERQRTQVGWVGWIILVVGFEGIEYGV